MNKLLLIAGGILAGYLLHTEEARKLGKKGYGQAKALGKKMREKLADYVNDVEVPEDEVTEEEEETAEENS